MAKRTPHDATSYVPQFHDGQNVPDESGRMASTVAPYVEGEWTSSTTVSVNTSYNATLAGSTVTFTDSLQTYGASFTLPASSYEEYLYGSLEKPDRRIRITCEVLDQEEGTSRIPSHSAVPATISFTDLDGDSRPRTSKRNWDCYLETLRKLSLKLSLEEKLGMYVAASQ